MFQLRHSQRAVFRYRQLPLRPSARTFTSTRTWRLKEDKEQQADEVEQAKQKQMKDGKSREELESASESRVKADQENVKDHDSHIKNLQKETAQKQEDEHPDGKS